MFKKTIFDALSCTPIHFLSACCCRHVSAICSRYAIFSASNVPIAHEITLSVKSFSASKLFCLALDIFTSTFVYAFKFIPSFTHTHMYMHACLCLCMYLHAFFACLLSPMRLRFCCIASRIANETDFFEILKIHKTSQRVNSNTNTTITLSTITKATKILNLLFYLFISRYSLAICMVCMVSI